MNNRNWLGFNRGQNFPNHAQPYQSFPNQSFPNQSLPAQSLPTRTAPTQVAPAQVSPTRQYVQTNISNTVVPHYHPSHLTTVNKHIINNQHHFPHTESVVNECFETNTMCGTPFRPCGLNSCSKCRGRW